MNDGVNGHGRDDKTQAGGRDYVSEKQQADGHASGRSPADGSEQAPGSRRRKPVGARNRSDPDDNQTELIQIDLVERAERDSGVRADAERDAPSNTTIKEGTQPLAEQPVASRKSTKNKNPIEDVEPIDEKQVCDWLQDNPDLFSRRPELLSQLTLPHVEGTDVSSLIERQVDRLRAELRTLQAHFDSVVESARLFEQQQTRVHRLAHRLVAATDRDAVVTAVRAGLKDDFNIDQVVVRLQADVDDDAQEAYAMLRDRVAQGRSICDDRLPARSMKWLFDANRERVASCAVVPIRASAEVIGIIGLADADENRFGRDMGTVYLDQLGELIGAALARL